MKNTTFWIRLFIGGAFFLLTASRLHSQNAPISFDALPRASKPAPSPAAKAPVKPVVAKAKTDTVHVVDTVRVVVRDTTVPTRALQVASAMKPVSTPAPAVAPSAAKAAAKPDANAALALLSPTAVSGLFQFQAIGGDSLLRSTYRVRRAELKLISELGKHAQAIVMVDVSKALSLSTSGTNTSVTKSSLVLQDALISMPVGRVQIDAGQQRLPLGYEGSSGASSLETVDRALMESDRARGGAFGDVRDLGVAAKGKWRVLDYRAGVFNGSGETMNDVDKNSGKAVVAQFGVRPTFLPGLRLGASAVTSGKAAGDKPTRDRVGADVLYKRGYVLLQAEAMHGQDGGTQRFGGYVLTGLTLTPTVKLVSRFDAWDPDISKEATATDVTERDYLGGLTWAPSGTRLKLQFAVVRKTYTREIVPSVRQVLTQIQASW